MLCSLARLDGYRSAMTMAGLPIDPALVRYGDYSVESGFEHGMDLLAGPGRPTAVFAGSDLQALGVLEAARVRGLRVLRTSRSSATTTCHWPSGRARR